MNIEPEHVANLAHGVTAVQIVILILLGIAAGGSLILVVRWVVDIKVGPLPADMKEIKDALGDLRERMTQIEGKLWSDDKIHREIKLAVARHELNCPLRCGGCKSNAPDDE